MRQSILLLQKLENSCAGAHADYSRDDYVFPRTQSLAMRAAEWGRREKPLKSWGGNIVVNLAVALLA